MNCTCQPTDDLLLTLLEGRERPLCELHDADEIAERRQAEQAREIAETDAHWQRVLRRVDPEPEPQAEPDVRQLIVDQLTGTAGSAASYALGGPGIDAALNAALGPTTQLDNTETY